MRRRLIASTLAVALLAIVVLGGPLLVLVQHSAVASAQARVYEQAVTLAARLEDQLDAGRPVDLARASETYPGRRIEVVPRVGVATAEGPDAGPRALSSTVFTAGSTVTVRAPRSAAADESREATGVVLLLAGLALSTALVLAVAQGRRLARPVADLAARAAGIGEGHVPEVALQTGIPEVDEVGRLLDRSARRLGALLDVQRQFAGDAAHQLRTPLTGIGLRLDEIARLGDPAVAQEAEAALTQVERLDDVITSLLARTRDELEAAEVLDLSQLAAAEAQVWTPVLGAQGRALVLDAPPGAHVRARRGHLLSVLSVLLDNASTHGAGATTITVRAADGWATVAVEDTGVGVPDDLAERIFERSVSGGAGTGIGLALARSLAAADDATLELDPVRRARFVLTLERAPSDPP